MSGCESGDICGFEGPEKKLEIDFKRTKLTTPEGLRAISRDEWQVMLDHAKCTILNETSNDHCTSFVLSESSLFVFPLKVILKTCGTTTLLRAIPTLLDYAERCHLDVEWVFYSRRNFIFPHKQPFPHNDFSAEVRYLNEYFDGSAHVMGDVTGTHWNVYVADYVNRPVEHPLEEQTLEIMMTDLDDDTMKNFIRGEDFIDAAHVTKTTGIADLIPGAVVDDFAFDPCGYSCNALLGHTYFTIHVTPESHCSYVSFETNVQLHSYTELISKVLAIFKPRKFTVVLFSDDRSVAALSQSAFNPQITGYASKHKTTSDFGEGDYTVTCCNYQLRTGDSPLSPTPSPIERRRAQVC